MSNSADNKDFHKVSQAIEDTQKVIQQALNTGPTLTLKLGYTEKKELKGLAGRSITFKEFETDITDENTQTIILLVEVINFENMVTEVTKISEIAPVNMATKARNFNTIPVDIPNKSQVYISIDPIFKPKGKSLTIKFRSDTRF